MGSPRSIARLLWLTETYFPSSGGMAQSCDRIVHGLRQSGVQLDLVHLVPAQEGGQSGLIDSTERIGGTNTQWALEDDVPHSMNHLFASLEGSGANYSHVVAFGGRHPLAAAPTFAAWLGAELVTLLRGNDFDSGIFSVRNRPALMEALRASQTICTVTREKQYKVRALLPGADVLYTPNGIDLTDWCLLPSHREAAKTWRTDERIGDRIVLGGFGHLKRKKGVDLLVDAIAASGIAEEFHLRLVGTVDPEVESRLAQIDRPLSVSRTGFLRRSQLPAEYAKCDYAIIPSFYDGMPNVLLEAGGLGLPLIAADTGGMRDVLVDRDHGFLFPPGDTAACRDALLRAHANSAEQREAMGQALRERIAETFSAEQERARYLELFQQPTTASKP